MTNVTISDIAKEAGVSKSTVSRVLNNPETVKFETREQVMNVIKKRNFVPSATAINLSKQISSTIGVIIPEFDNPFFGEVLRGITEVVDEHGFTLICCTSDDSALKDLKALSMLKTHRVKGLIYTPAVDYGTDSEKKKLDAMLKYINTPVVLLDREANFLNLDGVFFNDYQGMYDATKILIKQGHKNIGIVNGTLDRVLSRIRHKGFIDALNDEGIIPNDNYMFFGDFRMKKAYELSKKMLAMKNRPTAVLTCNNKMSMGFLKALYERGETIPDDISCIGLDQIEELQILGIKFNYIKRDAQMMGKRAMELLISRILNPDKPKENIIINTTVVIK